MEKMYEYVFEWICSLLDDFWFYYALGFIYVLCYFFVFYV